MTGVTTVVLLMPPRQLAKGLEGVLARRTAWQAEKKKYDQFFLELVLGKVP